jgi:peptidoglycan/LPS O-acetylase OafA/YrhL
VSSDGGVSSERPPVHVPGLDGLRGVALLLVVLFHARIPGFANGDLGVDVFFVLSGFLITGILLRSADRGGISLADFYRRRALRLLPAYVTVLVVCVVVDVLFDSGGTLKGAATSFFYVSNWAAAAGTGLGLLAHTWSLSIEEQFYLLWPLALASMLRRAHGNTSTRLLRLVGLVTAVLWASILVAYLLGVSPVVVSNATGARGAELLAGCLVAVAVQRRRALMSSASQHGRTWPGAVLPLLCLTGLVAVASRNFSDPWLEILVQWPVVVGLTVVVILACLTGAGPAAVLLSWRPLVLVGKVSYGAYLWHFPIFVVVDEIAGLDTWLPRLCGLALTAAVVPLSYRFVERPFLRLKDRRPAPTTTELSGAARPAGDRLG